MSAKSGDAIRILTANLSKFCWIDCRIIDPLHQLLRQVSAFALFPVFMLFLGIGESSKIAIIVWAAFWPVLLNTISGVKQVERVFIDCARSMGASQGFIFTKVVLPAALPQILTGIRLASAYSITALVAAEMIDARSGLVLRHGNVHAWSDLKNRSICASRRSLFAARAAQRGQATLQSFDRPLDALLAFQAGECAALVDDEYVIRALLKQPDWAYYRELPDRVAPAPAFIASRGGDVVSAVFIERTVGDWRRERWLSTVRHDQATRLAFDMFNADNDLYLKLTRFDG